MSEIILQNDYDPSDKANLVHGSDARIIVCVGGLGSGKSRTVIEEVKMTALEYPNIPMAVYRKTMPALRDSTLQEFRSLMPSEVGQYKERLDKYLFNNNAFVNFRGLDDPTKAKSTEYALIVMEEAEEFTLEDFRYLSQRVRKKGPWPLRIILVLNPVDETHWIYKEFVENADLYHSSGGLLVVHFSTYDNIKNLPPGYIESTMAGLTPEEIDRYIHGNWGTIIRGKPVYAGILNDAVHLYKMPVADYTELLRGWDFGFNHPACSFRVVDKFGRMNCKFSMMGDKEHLDEFAVKVLHETNLRFGTAIPTKDFGDPRGHDKTQNSLSTGNSTAFEILQELGINALGERGSREYVEEGVRQVRKEFSTLINGVPQLTIDPNNSLIKAAYFGRYVRGPDGKPRKDKFYEHIADADRYISHHDRQIGSNLGSLIDKRKARRLSSIRNKYTGY